MIYEWAAGFEWARVEGGVPGGASCPALKADEIDVAMDFDSVAKAGRCWGRAGWWWSTTRSAL